jgi:hypothetical protein
MCPYIFYRYEIHSIPNFGNYTRVAPRCYDQVSMLAFKYKSLPQYACQEILQILFIQVQVFCVSRIKHCRWFEGVFRGGLVDLQEGPCPRNLGYPSTWNLHT